MYTVHVKASLKYKKIKNTMNQPNIQACVVAFAIAAMD